MRLRLPLIVSASAIIGLAACTDQYGNPVQMNRTQQGAIAGAAAGGLYGLVRDSDKNNKGSDLAKGAIFGAAIGGLAGNILDQQAKALQQQVTTPGVSVQRAGNAINVNLPESVLFAHDSAAVSGPAVNDLYAVARNLNSYPNTLVEVIGHTDSTGTAAYNQTLSERRASAVAGIIAAGGVDRGRIATIGRGEAQPVASNDTAAGRAQNRRVEIIIRPM